MNVVLLLGGTGAIGRPLASLLVQRGFRVVVTTRSLRSPVQGVEFLQGDARNDLFFEEVLQRVKPDVIVDFMIYKTEAFSRRVGKFLASCRQYIFLSSYTVFAKADLITEHTPRILDVTTDACLLASDAYPIAKARCEDLLRESGRENWTIVRPGITYGDSRIQFGCLESHTWLFRALQGLPVPMPDEMMDCLTTMTWAGDVARMLSALVLNSLALHEDFNLATTDCMTWRSIAELYEKLVGLQVASCSINDYAYIVGSEIAVRDRLSNRRFNSAKILAIAMLDRGGMKTISSGLSEELQQFLESPRYQYQEYFKSARIDRILGTRTNLRGQNVTQRLAYYGELYPALGRGISFLRSVVQHPDKAIKKSFRVLRGRMQV